VGIKLFNDGAYFEAHDFFEDLWMEAEEEERDLYQGLVQVSVGSYHLVCGNYTGSLSQYLKGVEKLKKYKKSIKIIDLEKFLEEIQRLINKIIMFNSKKISNIEVTKIPILRK
jgi:predicted metal-dependent hydrolase